MIFLFVFVVRCFSSLASSSRRWLRCRPVIRGQCSRSTSPTSITIKLRVKAQTINPEQLSYHQHDQITWCLQNRLDEIIKVDTCVCVLMLRAIVSVQAFSCCSLCCVYVLSLLCSCPPISNLEQIN